MAVLESTEDLKNYVLRRLGSPVINIEVADEQLNDRIDDVLQRFVMRHYNGATEVWEAYQLTAKDISRGYITLKNEYVAVLEIIQNEQTGSGGEQFDNLNFLIANTDIVKNMNIGNLQLQTYAMTMEHIATIRKMFSPQRNFTFNSATHNLKIYGGNFSIGDFICLHVYKAVDPEAYVDAYNEKWVKDYATALIKKQWGSNIKKYDNVPLVGGITMKGKEIYDEAVEEVEKLEAELIDAYELPLGIYFG